MSINFKYRISVDFSLKSLFELKRFYKKRNFGTFLFSLSNFISKKIEIYIKKNSIQSTKQRTFFITGKYSKM